MTKKSRFIKKKKRTDNYKKVSKYIFHSISSHDRSNIDMAFHRLKN